MSNECVNHAITWAEAFRDVGFAAAGAFAAWAFFSFMRKALDHL